MTTKNDTLLARLQDGWASMSDLVAITGWQAHTLRAAISRLAKRPGIKIERHRENDVTSYRVKQ
jgi:hypothetical protein